MKKVVYFSGLKKGPAVLADLKKMIKEEEYRGNKS